jgi:5'-phosphate synthase pdxT subunit
MKVGIVAIQGNVEEHVDSMQKVLEEREKSWEIIKIKRKGQVGNCDAVVIPGGESTTIGRLMHRGGISAEIVKLAEEGVPVLGTCAGLILLAKNVSTELGSAPTMRLMDIWVERNAFGRQRESFEVSLKIPVLGEKPYNAVFIRAPAITKAGRSVEVLATHEEYIVAARQKNLLALAFHPELTEDGRFHHFFLNMVK